MLRMTLNRDTGASRGALLIILILGMTVTLVELYLLEHTETMVQIIPILCLVAGLVAALGAAATRTRGTVRILQAVMVSFVVAGALGIFFHYRGNTEFELEMYPSLGGYELFRESMMGATPALAPGTMAWLGLLGLAYTFRHPRLARSNKGNDT
jgi:hypothetical protein